MKKDFYLTGKYQDQACRIETDCYRKTPSIQLALRAANGSVIPLTQNLGSTMPLYQCVISAAQNAIFKPYITKGDKPVNLHVMAGEMAFFLIRKEIIKKDKAEICSYGLVILFATVINGVLVAATSLVLGVFWQSVLMLVPFMLIRANAGGFHAETQTGCMLGFMIVYLACVLFAMHLPPRAAGLVALAGLFTSTAIVLAVGPLPHKNRPVSSRELEAYQVKARLFTAGLLCLGLAGLYFIPVWTLNFSLEMDIAVGSLLAG